MAVGKLWRGVAKEVPRPGKEGGFNPERVG